MSKQPAKTTGTKSNLDRLREQYNKNKSEGGGNFNWWKPNFGNNTIRVLPPTDEENALFYYETARHQIDEDWFYCLKYKKDADGKTHKCPACDARKKLFRSEDKGLVAIAKKLKAKKQYMMNIIDRKAEDPTQVFLYAPGVKLWTKMVQTMLNNDIDITDVENGYDFLVMKEEGAKTEKGTFPSYDNSEAKRKSSPLSDDPKVSKKILDARLDLESIPKFEDEATMQAALDTFVGGISSGTSNDEFYDEPEEGDKPKPSTVAGTKFSKFKNDLHKQLRTEDIDDIDEPEATDDD
jgi:hypothetical protein